jgi:nicotinate-nucleotide pyrophosphorylase (carboxylating)
MDIIGLENLGLKYRLCHERPLTLKENLFNIFHRRQSRYESLWALKGIELTVKKGEILGLIGKNGSGKTTFLKLIAGILAPTRGRLIVRGKVSPMLSIGVGFHPELTGRENIYLSGSILGLSRKDMREKLDEIVGFSELERFIDTPVRHYSTGMYMRLGFSIATSVDPDILLIDEVLAVGDEGFQKKCYEKIDEFKRRGKTIIFVSHDLDIVSRVSTRLALLSHGIKRALREDIGPGDITSRAVILPKKIVKAEIIARERGIIGGVLIAKEVFQLLDKKIKFTPLIREGKKVRKGEKVAVITGNVRAILSGERVALNFMQRISGIATETAKCVDMVKGFKTLILDTRKTPPGLRFLDKYAVRLGGGKNHRFGLYDMILIKDNHIACSGGAGKAVKSARKKYPHEKIEVEVKIFKELKEAVAAGANIVMLDNMNLKQITQAIKIINGRSKVEVSGNVPINILPELAGLGVDYISLGRLTHSSMALDLSLRIVK